MMRAEYNKQGAARKELADVISQITGEDVKYLFLPTKAYQIGSVLVGKDGTVECEDTVLFQRVVQELAVKGFWPENKVAILEEVVTPEETSETDEIDTLTISLPDDLTDEDFEKLQNLVASKASLFKKALSTNDLTIQREDGKISFPWFHETDSTRIQAYSKLVTALCQMARNSKRITAKEHEVPNEKYAFRCFLLRLGFIGAEYKGYRKILLERLSGSAAYRMEGKKMRFPNKEMLEFLHREYPSGTRVVLIRMDDLQAPPLGTKGTVTGVDDMGSLLVEWDNGSHLNVIHGVDVVQKLNKETK